MQSSGFYSLGSSVRIPATDAFLVDSGNNTPTGTLPDPPATAVAGTGPPVRRFMYDHAATHWRVNSEFDSDPTGESSNSLDPGSWETIEWIADSRDRLHLLETLRDGPVDLVTVAAEQESSPVTLQRDITSMMLRGWVTEESSGYRTTASGRLLTDAVTALLERIGQLTELTPFLTHLDEIDGLEISKIADCTVTTARPARPYRAENRLFERFANTTDVRGLFPLFPAILDREGLNIDSDTTMDAEVILPEQTIVRADDRNRIDRIETELDRSAVDLFVCNEPPPYAVVVVDDGVVLVAYNDVGRVQAIVESSAAQTIEWATAIYDEYRRCARRVRPDTLPLP